MKIILWNSYASDNVLRTAKTTMFFWHSNLPALYVTLLIWFLFLYLKYVSLTSHMLDMLSLRFIVHGVNFLTTSSSRHVICPFLTFI